MTATLPMTGVELRDQLNAALSDGGGGTGNFTGVGVSSAELITQAELDALELHNDDVAGRLYVIQDWGLIADDMFARNVSNGMGSAPVGGAYALTGTSTEFQTIDDGNEGVVEITHTTNNSDRWALLTTNQSLNQYGLAEFMVPVVPVTSSFFWFALSRVTSITNGYRIRGEFTATTFKLVAQKMVTTTSDLGTQSANLFAPVGGQRVRMRWETVDAAGVTTLRARAWRPAVEAEPSTWPINQVDNGTVLGSPLGSGGTGFYTRAGSGGATVPFKFKTYKFQVASASA